MHILVAPDKFKGSLGAQEVGERIAAGLRATLPRAEIEVLAIADGGEGTAEAINRARGGQWVSCAAHDALGRAIEPRYAWLQETWTAVIEMSAAAGLQQLAPDERNPLISSTFGVGEMLIQATKRGVRALILGLGGSATNDGGWGLARALGFRFLAAGGQALERSVAELQELETIARPPHFQLPPIVIASDVKNPLLGPRGATRTFGPQKGATPGQLEILESALARLADVAARDLGCDYRDTPGAGAAGGLGFGLLTFCGAKLRSGFEVVAEAIDLRSKIRQADAVITGEGKLDRQTLEGKGPAGVARLARELGKPVFTIVGQADDDLEVRQLFDAIETLDDRSPDFTDTPRLLELRAQQLAERFRPPSIKLAEPL